MTTRATGSKDSGTGEGATPTIGLRVSVRHTAQLLERQAAELDLRYGPPRELAMNAIQAVQRVGGGAIRWTAVPVDGVRKLGLVDTGVGMTVDQTRYLAELGTSGQELASRGNMGAGFKLLAIAVSPRGCRYRTYTAGAEHGVEVVFEVDPDEGPGLRTLRSGPDGWWAPISWDLAPREIREAGHGTEVVLMGHADDADTAAPPTDTDPPSWLRRALNGRLFRIPPEIRMTIAAPLEAAGNIVAQVAAAPRPDLKVDGQETWLNAWSIERGSVPLRHATARWWVLNDKQRQRRNQASHHVTSGHVASLFQDELYDVATLSRGGTDRLGRFGVRAGAERVVIYVEPDEQLVLPNTARTRLLLDPRRPDHLGLATWRAERELPWEDWAEEFAQKLPTAIRDLQRAAAAGPLDAHTLRTELARELAGSSRLRRISAFRTTAAPEPRGQRPAARDDDTPQRSDGDAAGEAEHSSGITTQAAGRRLVAPTGEEWARRLLPAPAPPKPVARTVRAPRPDDIALAEWVALADGSRAPGELDDRAASYDRSSTRLRINLDFRLLRDLQAAWEDAYEHLPAATSRPLIEQVVRTGWYERLARAIWTVEQLAASTAWDAEQANRATSPEALTLAVADRTQMDAALRHRLAQKLGAPRDQA